MKAMRAHSRTIVAVLVFTIAVAGAMVWWFGIRSSVQDARAAVEDACGAMAAADSYDVTMEIATVVDGEAVDVVTAIIRFSGDDQHGVLSTAAEGTVAEYVLVGGVVYIREFTQGISPEWAVGAPPSSRSADPFGFLGSNPVCPDIEELTEQEWGAYNALGEEQLNGVTTQHFTDGGSLGPVGAVDGALPVGSYSEDRRHEFWIDPDGQLVQTKEEWLLRFQVTEGAPPIQQRTHTTSTFSGIGEPNVITAPSVPDE